jgi:hypothetical protein
MKNLAGLNRDFREELGRVRFLDGEIHVIAISVTFQKTCAILAVFNRDFRFTGQKHIYALAKREPRRCGKAKTKTQRKTSMKHTRIFLIALLGAAAVGLPTLRGASITVTTINDNGPGSLRQALADAVDGDTINFASSLNGQTITLGSGELLVNKSVTINGPGANTLTVDANHASRVFYIASGKDVTISGLTITNGSAPNPYFRGGGIYNDHATLTVNSCTISGNSAFPGVGGGIFNHQGTLTVSGSTLSGNSTWYGGAISNNWLGGGSATVTIINSTLTGNSAISAGGGIINQDGTVTLSNSTVSGNSTENGGGGIENHATLVISNSTFSGNSASYGGGIFNEGTLTITNSTVSGNSAGGYSNIYDGRGGAIWNRWTLTVTNSTLSGNSALTNGGGIYNNDVAGNAILKIGDTILNAGSSGGNIYNEADGTVTSLGYNLSSDNGGGFLTATGDRINTDPRLGPLQNNGGPTFTHMPASNSPAIDAGDATLGMDQRGAGFQRVANGRIDIGATEVQATPAPTPKPHGHH